jgi:hypothetical protein
MLLKAPNALKRAKLFMALVVGAEGASANIFRSRGKDQNALAEMDVAPP